jgi:hypothetical protein
VDGSNLRQPPDGGAGAGFGSCPNTGSMPPSEKVNIEARINFFGELMVRRPLKAL